MNYETRLDLLATPVWSIKNIKDYLGVKSATTAIKLKKRAISEFNGSVPYGSQFVSRDSFLKMLGTTLENEISKLKIIKENV